jgi:ABC-type transport system involved in Fe-S cluster assembly fused permease/ATPase subunit
MAWRGAASVGFKQLRDAVFARVAQRALRQLALETFQHIHALSCAITSRARPAGCRRIIERGVKGVEFLLRFLLFSIGPLILELSLTGIVLAWCFRHHLPRRAGRHHRALYLVHLQGDRMAGEDPREMNAQDTDANQKAIDSLLNFETVKYFGAEAREADRYDAPWPATRKRRSRPRLARLPQFRPVADHHHGACRS